MGFDVLGTSHLNARSGLDAVEAAADHVAAHKQAIDEIRVLATRTGPDGEPKLLINATDVRAILDRHGL